MTFRNTILAGEELIRSAIRSKNFNEQEDTGWRIARDGTASFQAINTNGYATGPVASYDEIVANSSLIYRGRQLASILHDIRQNVHEAKEDRTGSIVAYGQFSGDSAQYPGDGNIYYPLAVNIPEFPANRSFLISWFGTIKQLSTGYLQLWLHVGGVNIAYRPISGQANSGASSSFTWNVPINSGNGGTDVPVQVGAKGGAGWQFLISDLEESRIAVYDTGGSISDTSYRTGNPPPGGGGQPPAKTWRTVEAACTGGWSYGGQGELRNTDGGHLYQGEATNDSFWGNQFSFVWFQRAEFRELVGLSNSDIDYVEFYLYFIHWWSYSGGVADIGWHSLRQANRGGNNPLNNRHGNIATQHYSSRHQGRWMRFQPTNAIVDAIQRGDFEGLQIGVASPNNHAHYGYAAGDNELGHQPVMRMRYRK